MQQHYQKQPPAVPAPWGEDSFELFNRIPPVVLIVKEGRGLHAIEHVNAAKLMRQLDRFGRDGVRILGMITGESVLDRSSIRALNCYLRHGPGLDAFRRAPDLYRCRHPFHRFGWVEFKNHLGLRFTRA
jgi:hypothetical protein